MQHEISITYFTAKSRLAAMAPSFTEGTSWGGALVVVLGGPAPVEPAPRCGGYGELVAWCWTGRRRMRRQCGARFVSDLHRPHRLPPPRRLPARRTRHAAQRDAHAPCEPGVHRDVAFIGRRSRRVRPERSGDHPFTPAQHAQATCVGFVGRDVVVACHGAYCKHLQYAANPASTGNCQGADDEAPNAAPLRAHHDQSTIARPCAGAE